jgi:crotonobetainyl-CoA:carnitine CoA-transferase CaiB-like acyl-CoA transferase
VQAYESLVVSYLEIVHAQALCEREFRGPLPSLLAPPESEHWQQRLDAVPALGQHTDSILGELGYSSDEIAQLRGDAAV